MRSVQPPSNPRPTPSGLPRPPNPGRVGRLDVQPVLQGLGDPLRGPWGGSDNQRAVVRGAALVQHGEAVR